MRLLASRFTAARQTLDRAEALLSAQERVPVQQLRSLFGGTLAAAHCGLGDFPQLGQQSTYVTHRQTYARFVMGLIDRWVEPVGPRDEREKEVINGP